MSSTRTSPCSGSWPKESNIGDRCWLTEGNAAGGQIACSIEVCSTVEGESAQSAGDSYQDDSSLDCMSPASNVITGGLFGGFAHGPTAVVTRRCDTGNVPSVVEASAGFASTVRRFSMDITTGIANITQDLLKKGHDEEYNDEDDGNFSASSSCDHSPRAAVQGAPTVDTELLMAEVRKPFGQLLLETPGVRNVVGGGGAGRSASPASFRSVDSKAASVSSSRPVSPAACNITSTPRAAVSSSWTCDDDIGERPSMGTEVPSGEVRPASHVEIARTRLIGHVVGCCQALAEDLLPDELQLWNSFIRADTSMHGVLSTTDDWVKVRAVLSDLANSQEQVEDWAADLTERTKGDSEIDFADLLDWFDDCKKNKSSRRWSIQNLRSSFSQLLAGGAAEPPRLEPDVLLLIRSRLAQASTEELCAAATSYQRSLVLTSCWKCEQTLEHALGGRGATPTIDPALLLILRIIHGELAPSECVLWEFVGTRNEDFDGSYTQADVHGAVEQLFQYTLARDTLCEARTTEPDFEELHRLRVHCQKQSIANLFTDERLTVSLADVIRWWWDMPDDYRVAAGLIVPSELLRRSMSQQPEDMFRAQLSKVAASPSFGRVAVHGHARTFAELRCLALRRILEGFHGRSPTETRTTCTSVTVGEEEYDAA